MRILRATNDPSDSHHSTLGFSHLHYSGLLRKQFMHKLIKSGLYEKLAPRIIIYFERYPEDLQYMLLSIFIFGSISTSSDLL